MHLKNTSANEGRIIRLEGWRTLHNNNGNSNSVLVPIFVSSKSLNSEENMPSVYSSTTARNPLSFETRRVQSNGQSLITVLPKVFADRLGIERGDLVRFYMYNNDKRKIMLEKISTEELPPLNEGGNEIGRE